MPLIKCPECGKENVSDTAISCPNCGFAIREHFANIENIKKDQEKRQSEEKFLNSIKMPEKPHWHLKNNIGVCILGVLTLFFFVLGNIVQFEQEGFISICFFVCFFMTVVFLCISQNKYLKELKKYELAQKNFNEYKKQEMKRLKYIPKCPTCGSPDIYKIDGLERGASVFGLGLFSKKINKTYKCNNCGHTW